jgi:GNAT superfamily N-acetyltransferase
MTELKIEVSVNREINGVMTSLVIRPTTELEIAPYKKQASAEKIRFTPKTELFVIEDDKGTVYGFSGIDFQGSRAVFKNAYVMPEYRGNGIWRELFNYRYAVASMRKGIKTVEATCTPMSINLYLRLGAQVITEYKELTKVRIPL